MQVHANGTPFFSWVLFPVDIKPGKDEKSISYGQIRYAITIIYLYEKFPYLAFTVKEKFKK